MCFRNQDLHGYLAKIVFCVIKISPCYLQELASRCGNGVESLLSFLEIVLTTEARKVWDSFLPPRDVDFL